MDPDYKLFNPQEQLAIRNRSFGPHLVGAELEVIGQRGNAVLVRVEAFHHQPALADVGVHVAAEQRHGEHHRQAPHHHRLQGCLAGRQTPDADPLAQPEPGTDQEHAPDGQEDDGQRNTDRLGPHPDEKRHPAQFRDGRQPADPQGADHHKDRPDEAGDQRRPRVVHLGLRLLLGSAAAFSPAAGTGAVISGSSNLLRCVSCTVRIRPARLCGPAGACSTAENHRRVSEILASDGSDRAKR